MKTKILMLTICILLLLPALTIGHMDVKVKKDAIHGEKNMRVYEHYENPYLTTDEWLPITDNQWFGQSFTVGAVGPNEAHYLRSFKVWLMRPGTASGNISLKIYRTDLSGNPIGVALCTGSFNGTTEFPVAWEKKFFEIIVNPMIQLQKNTQYAFMFQGDSAEEFWLWHDISAAPLPGEPGYPWPWYPGGAFLFTGNEGATYAQFPDQPIFFEEYGSNTWIATQIISFQVKTR